MWLDVRTYARERLFIPKIWALWLFLLVVFYLVHGPSLTGPILGALFLTVSFVAFRLIDDIADRAHDSVVHPERCVVRTQYLGSFKLLAGTIVITATVLAFSVLGTGRGLCFFGLSCAVLTAGCGYALGQEHRAKVVHVILLKYPVLLLLVAPAPLRPQNLLFVAIIFAVLMAEEHFGRRAI